MKLTHEEQLVCRIVAMVEEPPPYDVVVIPGDSPPEWEDCDAYWLDIDAEHPIRTEIRVVVGAQYIAQSRVDRGQTTQEKTR